MRYDNVKMVEHIKKHNPNCPVCEQAEWILDQSLVHLPYHLREDEVAVRAVCTCSNCGYTILFDPYIADAIKE